MTLVTDSNVIPPRIEAEHAQRAAETPARCAFAERNDEELARLSQAGSLGAFGALVDRYERRLVGFLWRRAGDAATAEDLAQETFVRAWERIGSFDSERRFSTWLFTIGARIAADHHRRRRREAGAKEELERKRAREASIERKDAREDAAHGNLWATARRALTADQMEAVWLRYVMEMSIPDIAAALGRSRVGIRVLLFRARERLAAALDGSKNGREEANAGRRRMDGPGSEMGT